MAKVTVRTIGPLRQVLGGAQLEMVVADGETLEGLLRRLGEEKGGEFARYVSWLDGLGDPSAGAPAYSPLRVLLNGRDIFPDQFERLLLAEGDELLVFSPVAGG